MENLLSDTITADQAAARLGVSGGFIRNQARDGKIRHVKVGNRYRFRVQDIDAILTPIEPHNNAITIE